MVCYVSRVIFRRERRMVWLERSWSDFGQRERSRVSEGKVTSLEPQNQTKPTSLEPPQNQTKPTSLEQQNQTIPTSLEHRNHTMFTSLEQQNQTIPSSLESQNHTISAPLQSQNHTILTSLQQRSELIRSKICDCRQEVRHLSSIKIIPYLLLSSD